MTVADPNKIDMVARRPGTDLVRLVIADHLPWDDVHAHKLMIQEKVNTYIAFVESGQIHTVTQRTIPWTPDVTIFLRLMHEPPGDAVEFLGQVREFLDGVSLGFEWEVAAS